VFTTGAQPNRMKRNSPESRPQPGADSPEK
jgi:hypothetical protein